MNYRHAYHAGNFADVLKHLILVYVIEYSKKKDKPFRVIDTHAGVGIYDLDSIEASKTGEWLQGIGRLLGAASAGSGQGASHALIGDAIVSRYLATVEALAPLQDGGLTRYPGSPAIAEALLRPQDALIANELHPEDAAALANHFATSRQVKILNIDGWLVPKATLPPRERRGVVLIDPPFETPGEFDRMSRAMADGLRRFATGIYICWYPIKDPSLILSYKADAARVARKPMLCVEMWVRAPQEGGPLAGTGLLIHSPPFGLGEWLEVILPDLTSCLQQGPGARWSMEVVTPVRKEQGEATKG